MSSPSKSDAEDERIDVARVEAAPASEEKATDDPRLLPTTEEAPQLPPGERPSRVIGEYEVLGKLGSGGMGEVYKARHRRLNKLVALKLLPADSQNLREAAARFQREMKAIGDLDHPNVIEAHDAGEQFGTVYLAMKLIDGVDLERLVKKHGPLPIAEACELVRQAALGLHYLHERGLVHRDIKPSNLMRTPEGTVKVLDLGLARWGLEREQGHGLTGLGQAMGTPDFLAPEQVENAADADARADLYGLGGTLFYLLTGRPPFADHKSEFSKLQAHRSEPPPDVQTLRPDMPIELAALIHRLLAKNPEERYQTAAEVAAALAPFVDNATPEEVLESDWEASPPPVRAVGQTNRPAARKLAFGLTLGQWSCAVTLAIGTAVLVLISLPLWLLPNQKKKSDSSPQVASRPPSTKMDRDSHVQPDLAKPVPPNPLFPPTDEPKASIHVTSLDVMLMRKVHNSGLTQGKIGEKVYDPRLGDHVTVQARLTRPAYAFLIAFQANGKVDVCFPEKETELPTLTDKPRYPSTAASSGDDYELSEGEGLQAFAIVVSSKPLPSFKAWWSNYHKDNPWKKESATPGVVYRANGEDPVETFAGDIPRGKGAKAADRQLVSDLAQWLRKIRGVETVQVLAFAVGPQQKR